MDSEDNTFYKVLFAGLILGLIAAIALLIITPRENEPFSAVSFTNPDDLPNKVRLGNTYDFDYSIQSFEHEPKNYTLETNLELYRLYDTTEGLYSCLSPYRHKIYLDWSNETWNNETNSSTLSHISINESNPLIPDLIIIPDNVSIIDWENYYFSFSLGKVLGNGEFVIWFGSEYEQKYKFSIITEKNEVYFNDEYIGKINMSAQNDKIKIVYENNYLNFSYNAKTLMRKKIDGLTGGQFGFETRDVYISLSGMSVSKELKIEVPDTDNTWDYSIDTNLYFNLIGQTKQATKKDLLMDRVYIVVEEPEFEDVEEQTPATVDESGTIQLPEMAGLGTENLSEQEMQDALNRELEEELKKVPLCKNEFACNYLTTDDQNYELFADNISSVLLTLPQTVYGARYWLTPRNETDSLVAWENFYFNASYAELSDVDSMTFLFGEEFALMFTDNSYSILTLSNGTVKIQQFPIMYIDIIDNESENSEILIRNFSFSAKGNEIKFNIITSTNKSISETVYISSSLYNKSIKVLHWNTFSNIRELSVKNQDPNCFKENYFNFCEISYIFAPSRATPRDPDPSLYGSISQEQLDKLSTGNSLNYSDGAENIPSRQLDFNGQLAKLVNKTNTTFHIDYQYLDGEGIVQAGLKNDEGNIIFSITNYLFANKSVIQFWANNTTVNKKFNLNSWHSLDISMYEKNITFYHNKTTLYTIRDGSIRNGHFFINTIDTHTELTRVYIRNENTARHTNLPLLDDPCRLRLVHKENLRQEELILEPNSNVSFSNKFRLDKFFDYGKVSVSLNGSSGTNNTDLKIQFWMVRS